MELTNHGAKPIRALAWDFIFIDTANDTELKRQSLANLQKIDVNQKKTLRFTTQGAPPKIVSVGGLKKDQRSPFIESVSIRCLLFTDGTFWEQPKLKGACLELQQWIARRKNAPESKTYLSGIRVSKGRWKILYSLAHPHSTMMGCLSKGLRARHIRRTPLVNSFRKARSADMFDRLAGNLPALRASEQFQTRFYKDVGPNGSRPSTPLK